MPIQLINTGQTSNDGTGDTLRQGAIKVNQNFTDIYAALGDGITLTAVTGVDTARFADVSGIATNATLLNNLSPSYYTNYLNLTNTPTLLSSFTNDVGFLTKTIDASGINVVGGIVTATSFKGDGSQLTGISTSVDVGVLQSQINALGTNLNIVGFYDAVAGVVTGLTIVGQGRPGLGIGQTLPSAGITTGDYFIVSKGGPTVGIATYANPGISSVYSGDWVVGVDGDSWSILSYSQQVVAPRASRADIADGLDGNVSLNITGIITANQFFGNGGALTNLTSASEGSYGNDYTVPQISVNSQGKITGISNVAIALTQIAAGYGTAYWSKSNLGLTTTTAVGIGTTTITDALTVYGNINIAPASTGSLILGNLIRAKFGSTQQVQQYHNGSELRFEGNSPLAIRDLSGNPSAIFNPGGSVELYDSVTKKLETTGLGVTVFGSYLGDGSRLSGIITHIDAGENVSVQITSGIATINSSGGTGKWTSGPVGLGTTTSVGIGTTFAEVGTALEVQGNSNFIGGVHVDNLVVSGVSTLSGGQIDIPGGNNIKLGNAPIPQSLRNIGIGDQSIRNITSSSGGHNIGIGEYSLYNTNDGSYNVALGDRAGQNITTGDYNVVIGAFLGNNSDIDIRTSSNNIVISDGQGIVRQFINSQGRVGINTTILNETLNVAGIVSATGLYGTLNASNIIGQLPALDGSLLTNVTATGQGVEIRNNGSVIGVAATVNFSNNVDVSLGGGIATVTGAPNYWSSDGVGVNTTSNVYLYGNLNVEGDSYFGPRPVGIAATINFQGDKSRIAYEATPRVLEITNFDGTDSPGDIGSILFKTTDPGIPSVSKDALRIYSAGDNPDRLVRIYRNLQVDGESTLGSKAYVGSGVTLTTDGIDTSGIVTATSFSGSASGLTNVPSGSLTGQLPVLDGSNLINLPAQPGEGVNLKDDGFVVGAAKTVDAGTGIDIDFDVASGIATLSASGGSLRQRQVKVGVTTILPNVAVGHTDIIGFKAYTLMKVGLSTSSWLRLYTDSASRDADSFRSVGEDPLPGSGVIAEVVTTGLSTSQIMTPFVMGGNLNVPPDTTMYVSIQNLSGSSQSITTYLTILQLEA